MSTLPRSLLREMIEVELEVGLGYSKGDRKDKNTDNRRNGYSTRDINKQMNNIYRINLSAEMVSKITDKVIPHIK